MPSPITRTSKSPEETLSMGEYIGRRAVPGLFVALFGPLGAGKTVLTKGIARGLGIDDWDLVASPTFNITGRYEGRLPLVHVDAYRLGSPEELADLGHEEWICEEGVTALEWANRSGGFLPRDRLEIHIAHGGRDCRELSLSGNGEFESWPDRILGDFEAVSEGT